jgi:15-cis-phytoene synthase
MSQAGGRQAEAGLAASVRRHDPDRFLTALFAPPARRPALFALIAFNHELARAREITNEPHLALIRLQWWRDVVDGAARRHEVATPLSAALDAGLLDRADLHAMIDAREAEAEPAIETLPAWLDYVRGTAGGLAVATGRLLGASEPEALRPFGAAYGVAGILRSVSLLARQQRCLLPVDVLAAHGFSPEAVIAAPSSQPVLHALTTLAREGRVLLEQASGARIPRSAIAAALPAVLARRDLARSTPYKTWRGLGDRLAVVRAGLAGRI